MVATPRFRFMDWEVEFPYHQLNSTEHRLRGLGGKRRQVRLAVRGAVYRWSAMVDHGNDLIDALSLPVEQQIDRRVEANLFGLFVNAVATLECLGYAAFTLGSIRRSNKFPFDSDRARRLATFEATARTFQVEYPGHELTRALTRADHSRTYARLRDARNQLAHRAAIPRMVAITLSSRTLSWSLALDRGDDVDLTPEYGGAIQRLTAAHAYRLACGLDAFTREYFAPVCR